VRVLFDARPGDACLTGIGRYARTIADLLRDGVPGHQAWSLGRDVRLHATTEIGEELELPALLEREDIDLFHSPLFRLPALLPCRAIVTIHDAIPAVRPGLSDPTFTRLFEARAKDAAHRASAVVCPSEHAKKDVARVLGLPEEKIHVVPETPDPVFQRLSGDESRRVYTKFEITGAFVLVVGSLEARKNPAVVLDALTKLGKSAPIVVFVGPDAGFPLLDEAQTRGVAHVRKLGTVSDQDLTALLNEATALVFPSQYEGFGLPIVEAFACDTPVVASSASSIPEVAGDGAILFDPTRPDALADALDRVLGSPVLREELRTRGRARLQEHFSRDAVKKALSQLYSVVESLAGSAA
jgi:alpha-1,3-rhamnosyl/mannosyltransferase